MFMTSRRSYVSETSEKISLLRKRNRLGSFLNECISTLLFAYYESNYINIIKPLGKYFETIQQKLFYTIVVPKLT